MRLHLTCILQFSYPIGLLLLQAGHLSLNLNSFLVFFIDASNQVKTLLLALEGELLGAQLFLLLFLATDHMFHGLSLELVRLFLHIDHFLVLHALLFQTLSLFQITLVLRILVEADGGTLLVSHGCVALRPLLVFVVPLAREGVFFVAVFLVSLTYLHDLHRLLLRILDFFPRLYIKEVTRTTHEKDYYTPQQTTIS